MFSRILLFDIDGTLLLSGRAGYRALTRTFEELFGVPRGFDDIPVAGRTDELILTAAADRAGVAIDAAARARFHRRYCELFADEIHFPGPRKGLMPGVSRLLDALAGNDAVRCGLVTGNFARPARIKLEHFDLWRYFGFGAYGDDAPVRDALVPIAVERARRVRVEVRRPGDVVVIGDTPLDVQCAAAAGARCVAVATGSYDEPALREAGAHDVLPDFSDTETAVAARGGPSWPAGSLRRRTGWRGRGPRGLRDGCEVGGSAWESNPAPPRWRGATDFEDREGHRAPFASSTRLRAGRRRGSGRRQRGARTRAPTTIRIRVTGRRRRGRRGLGEGVAVQTNAQTARHAATVVKPRAAM